MSGIYSSGLYRSVLEQQKKDAVFEEIQGVELDYSGNRFEAGSLFARISLSKSFKNPNYEATFLNELSRYTIWGRGLLGNGMLMGEIAISTLSSLALSIASSLIAPL